MRIAPARDGGLCRIRLASGELTAAQARAVAQASLEFGSGFIDATNRANLQIRGVREDSQEALVSQLVDAGLGPVTPGSDDQRNVMSSPLAGLDSHALLDVAPLVSTLIGQMQRDARLHQLSPKFALMVDGGERLAMLDHPHDVWLSAVSAERLVFGLAGRPPRFENNAPALAAVKTGHVPALVDALLQTFLDLAQPWQTRMRDLLTTCPIEEILGRVQEKLGFLLDRDVEHWRRPASDARLRFGVHRQGTGDSVCVGAQVPLGRLDAATLSALADLAPRIRMTPWQSVMLLDVPPADARPLVEQLAALGLATSPDEPFARLIACTGSPGCAKSFADTKADAQLLARSMPPAGDVHLSGCARSCAAAHRVETTLMAVAPGRYDLYGDAPEAVARHLTIEQAARWLARSTPDA
ncbi:Sulfite reductase (plasmid) [Caballeronia sp. SBC1]|uniref:precorrin-3B synthase n=2 Tax=unclassified Caballeronia TaxID=2646786 RepID=UPI0013E1D55C|nr:precorrin-3B synthase [Caballeronia sp. SBC1]QIE28404.1 Sulfite reductase [Caballeronia sp. SBC2]QIN66461.1 Sulfite reductase [Caballeronia sp. SBC1]